MSLCQVFLWEAQTSSIIHRIWCWASWILSETIQSFLSLKWSMVFPNCHSIGAIYLFCHIYLHGHSIISPTRQHTLTCNCKRTWIRTVRSTCQLHSLNTSETVSTVSSVYACVMKYNKRPTANATQIARKYWNITENNCIIHPAHVRFSLNITLFYITVISSNHGKGDGGKSLCRVASFRHSRSPCSWIRITEPWFCSVDCQHHFCDRGFHKSDKHLRSASLWAVTL